MKEQLTIQELSAYLPYKVMCLNQHLPDVEFVKEELIGISNHITWSGVFNTRHGSNHVPVSAIKPILLPLSSLTQEIEHKGESFVPMDYIADKYYTQDWAAKLKRCIEDERWVYHLDYSLILHLHQWHFDTFGLLERGLAVNKLEI